jgi:hypothetical protein
MPFIDLPSHTRDYAGWVSSVAAVGVGVPSVFAGRSAADG